MEITEVKITLNGDVKVRAFASIVFDGQFVVRDIRIMRGEKGYFVSMPARRLKDGTYKDIAHPISSELRKKIDEVLMREFFIALEKEKEELELARKVASGQGDISEIKGKGGAPKSNAQDELPF